MSKADTCKKATALEPKLKGKLFLGGSKPDAEDVKAFNDMLGNNPALHRWVKNMASFSEKERAAWGAPFKLPKDESDPNALFGNYAAASAAAKAKQAGAAAAPAKGGDAKAKSANYGGKPSEEQLAKMRAEKEAAKAAKAAAGGDDKKDAAPKKEKKEKAPKAPAAAEGTSMSKVALRVGKIVEVTTHPDSTKLFIEKVDMGEGEPRTILSGLREFVTAEEFLGRNVIVAANLAERKVAGIPSNGMVLCASIEDGDNKQVKLMDVPEGAKLGERLVFAGHEGEAEPVLKKKLAKHFEEVLPELKIDAEGNANYLGIPFNTSAGPVTCKALKNAQIS